MSKDQQSFSKKERERKRLKKQKDKKERREQRKVEKAENGKLTFEEQLAYVDENGNLTSTKPDPSKRKKIAAEDIELGVPQNESVRPSKERVGIVQSFREEKGFGFIIDEATRENVFVHINDAYPNIQAQDRVLFEVEQSPKGKRASNVQPLPVDSK